MSDELLLPTVPLRNRVDYMKRIFSNRKGTTEGRRMQIKHYIERIKLENLKETLIELIMARTFCFNDILEFVSETLKNGSSMSFDHIFSVLMLASKIENIKKR